MKKLKSLKRTTKVDFLTYLGVTVAFILISVLNSNGGLSRSQQGWLVPVCCYIVMAVSLNLVVGISGELSLGHAGFMSVGAFSSVITAMSLAEVIPSAPVRLAVAILVGAVLAGVAGILIGIPVLRLRGDYLAIVTLAFGEIIKDLMNCLVVNVNGKYIVKGAQGTTGITTISSFTAGFVLIMITLVIVLNLVRSRAGRAIMAIRDNRIAAESVGLNITKYKMMAFVTSAALAGAAGALYGLNLPSFKAAKFNFNLSILVLVYVVLGGLGNIWGSIVAATVLYILPEALREFSSYRMLVYAIVLIIVMIVTNNPTIKTFFGKVTALLKRKRPAPATKGGAQQ